MLWYFITACQSPDLLVQQQNEVSTIEIKALYCFERYTIKSKLIYIESNNRAIFLQLILFKKCNNIQVII